MPTDRDVSPWVVVDHELLSRLGPASSRADWEKTLRRTGLWELDELDGAEGRDLAAVRTAVATWPVEAEWRRPARRSLNQWWGTIPSLLFIGILGAAFMGGSSAETLLLGLAGGMVTMLTAAAVWLNWPSAAGPALPQLTPHPDDANRALRRFLARTFVEVAGGKIVENTPHRAYLELRLEKIDGALRAADAKHAEMAALRGRIRATNTRMGHAADDVETARLGRAIVEQEAARERVRSVRAMLAGRLSELDAQLARLRAIAERRALSARVSQLTDGGVAQDPVERVAAEVEVDVAEIEGRVRELALEVGDADARLAALLEVVGATRERA